MSKNNANPTLTSPSEAEIIKFTANTSIPVSLWEPEIIDLTGRDSSEVGSNNLTAATLTESHSDHTIIYAEPESYEDDLSVESELCSPTEVDFDSVMGYFGPDTELDEDNIVETESLIELTESEFASAIGYFRPDSELDEDSIVETESLTELTGSEFASALGCSGPPPKPEAIYNNESETSSPTEVDFDYAMGYFGPDPDLDDNNVSSTKPRPELEQDSIPGYRGPDRKIARRAKLYLK